MRAGLLLLCLLATGTAAAQPTHGRAATVEARRAFTRGVALMQRAQWLDALAELRRSIELHPTQVALFNAAMCLKNLGQHEEAIATLERLLDDLGDQATEERRAEYRAELEGLRARMGQVLVTADVPGAEVQVDGRAVGRTPLPHAILLLPGDHTVEVRQGARSSRRAVTVQAGEVRSIRLELRRPAPRPTSARARGPSPTLFWLTAGVAGVATVATVVLGSIALAGDAEYRETRTASRQDTGERLVLFTDVSLSVALLTAAGAVILWVLTDFDPARRGAL